MVLEDKGNRSGRTRWRLADGERMRGIDGRSDLPGSGSSACLRRSA